MDVPKTSPNDKALRVEAAPATAMDPCGGGESFALMVLGQSMAPEFNEGEIVIIEPDGRIQDGSYVLACPGGAWTLRQLKKSASGWLLHALNPAFPDLPLAELGLVRGVVIQKAVPGRRRASKFYC